MDKQKLEQVKALKDAHKAKLKGKDLTKPTRKELDELTITLGKMFGLIE